ncbi:MAG TPA: glycosyltransferase family 2 protein [Thermoanaerobaculia bacterium]|nr:glycosyltransferase family 2 protein [Thermoanaerobaculia bacterium]
MYKGKRIAVVVPAYCEERLIGVTLETMPDFVDRVIVVDDASPDATAERVEAYRAEAADGERVELVVHEENQGVGGAIASGYVRARDEGYDVAVVMAGDAQMDPADLPALLDPVVEGRADYAKGNRLFTGDAWKVIPRVRYLGNSMLSLLTKIASGYWQVADSQCGYTALGSKALATLDWSATYRRFGQPNDLLVRLNLYNFRVVDVPVKPIYGIGEKSGIKPFRMIPRLALLLLRLFFFRMWNKYVIRDFHPLIFFYTLGIGLFLPGLGLGLYLVAHRIWLGPVATTSALFAVFLFVTGLQSILFAMWFDMENVRRDR